MNNVKTKFLKAYDIVLSVLMTLLIIWTGFVIVYYALPGQTSELIAKALSAINNEEVASKVMDWINGLTIGAGIPTVFTQKLGVARYFSTIQTKIQATDTKTILANTYDILNNMLEFQTAEAYRFVNSPTMPAKARLHYKAFIEKLEGYSEQIEELKEQSKEKEVKVKKVKTVKKRVKKQVEQMGASDALI